MPLRIAPIFILFGLASGTALAAPPPATLPTRDVDVTYQMTRPAGASDQKPVMQRLRWAVADQKLRVDPPTPGLYIVMDYRSHLLSAVRPAERLVMRIHSDGAGLATPGVATGGPGSPGGFERLGVDHLAGLACTDWKTRDTAGELTVVCLTDDGVLLRARIGTVALVQAVQVTYGPIDTAAFDVPADYRRVVPPGAVP